MFRSWLVAGTSALLIGLVACGGDDGASVRNIGEPCPTAGSATAGSATAASGSGSATGASGSASGTEC